MKLALTITILLLAIYQVVCYISKVSFKNITEYKRFYDDSIIFELVNFSKKKALVNIFKDLSLDAFFLYLLHNDLITFIDNLTPNKLLANIIFVGVIFFIEWLIDLIIEVLLEYRIDKKYEITNDSLIIYILKSFKDFIIATILIEIIVVSLFFLGKINNILAPIIVYIVVVIGYYLLQSISPKLAFKELELKVSDDECINKAISKALIGKNCKINNIYIAKGNMSFLNTLALCLGSKRSASVIISEKLINEFEKEEVIAICLHEIGHLVNKDTTKLFIINATKILLVLLSYILLYVSSFSKELFVENASIALVFIFAYDVIFEFINGLYKILSNMWMRKFEKDADMFVVNAGYQKHLLNGLLAFSFDNIINILPNNLQLILLENHPPYIKRLQYIRACIHDELIFEVEQLNKE